MTDAPAAPAADGVEDRDARPPPWRRPLAVGVGLHLLLTVPLGLSLVARSMPWEPRP